MCLVDVCLVILFELEHLLEDRDSDIGLFLAHVDASQQQVILCLLGFFVFRHRQLQGFLKIVPGLVEIVLQQVDLSHIAQRTDGAVNIFDTLVPGQCLSPVFDSLIEIPFLLVVMRQILQDA